MRGPALGALLLILVATPVPALCAVCAPDACPMERAPRMEEAGCHGMTHAAAVPDATLNAMRPDCCIAAPAPDGAPAVPATTPPTPVPAPAPDAASAPTLHPSATVVAACESPPPQPLRPLYTLHSSLLI